MSPANLIKIAIALIIGVAFGLVYGWLIDPVEYTDIPPVILREDYRMDYVLMVAEAYQHDFDPAAAAHRLAILGSDPPAALAASALEYANRNNFTQNETQALQTLLTAMQTHQPQGGDAP